MYGVRGAARRGTPALRCVSRETAGHTHLLPDPFEWSGVTGGVAGTRLEVCWVAGLALARVTKVV